MSKGEARPIHMVPRIFSRRGIYFRIVFRFFFFRFWLLGFLAFRLLGFSSSWLFGFGFSHPSGFLAFAPFDWFLDLASRIISITTTLFESSLLRTSWGGTPPPSHPLLFRLFAE